VILPEDCQPGDLVGIFSPDGRTFRGQVIVSELTPEHISFTSALPPGTVQGDILCLIRRRDQCFVREAELPIISRKSYEELERELEERELKLEEKNLQLAQKDVTLRRLTERIERLEGTSIKEIKVVRRIKSSK
jgi:hypothetical protein